MIKSIVLIILIGVSSFIYIDIENENIFFSTFLPVIFVLSLMALGFWFVALFHKKGINQTDSHHGDSGGGFDGGGGDC